MTATPPTAAAHSEAVVSAEDDGIRLDRWFKRHHPDIAHGLLQKLLRKGAIRVDGARAETGTRLAAGQRLRLPALAEAPDSPRPAPTRRTAALPSAAEIAALQERVLYMDDDVLIIDKPAGLAVQGGSGLAVHLDAMLEGLRLGAAEPPRLVHRLDKDTSGVLALARNRRAAAALTAAFRRHGAGGVEKLYRAITVGVPMPAEGIIDQPLAKGGPAGRERVSAVDDGLSAVTRLRTLDRAGKVAALVELEPLTGRTHQLRVHCALIGCPILGDGKYGGKSARLPGLDTGAGLHLHALRLTLPLPGGRKVSATAPLPAAFRRSLSSLGLEWLED